jgi:hypothetical protein
MIAESSCNSSFSNLSGTKNYVAQIKVLSSEMSSVSVGSARTSTWKMTVSGNDVAVECDGYPTIKGTLNNGTLTLSDEANIYSTSGSLTGTYKDVYTGHSNMLGGFSGTAVSLTKDTNGNKTGQCTTSVIIQ